MLFLTKRINFNVGNRLLIDNNHLHIIRDFKSTGWFIAAMKFLLFWLAIVVIADVCRAIPVAGRN